MPSISDESYQPDNSINESAVEITSEKSLDIATALSSLFSFSEFNPNGDNAVIVQILDGNPYQFDDLQEFCLLAKSANVSILNILTTTRSPQAKYFVGQGKAQEIADAVNCHNANVVLINHCLTAAQTRNLEQLCQCRVVDRTGLILDIFAQRARSHEGKLQVELAQLKHLATRLIRRKMGLDQQKGAVGLRGPGETQLETDRRLIKVRINQLQQRLEKVAKQRDQNRRTRHKADIPTVSLVGYTNAGKSTLFNLLTDSAVYADNRLFATLDPTLRRLQLPDVGTTVFADTVGFVRELPHDLISAFKSTLQETNEASLLLHVIDLSDSRWQQNIDAVNDVLSEINAEEIPCLYVFNKIDKLENLSPRIETNAQGEPQAVYLSAQNGIGCDLLLDAIRARLKKTILNFQLTLPIQAGKLRHALYQIHAIRSEQVSEAGEFILDIVIDEIAWQKLCKKFAKELGALEKN